MNNKKSVELYDLEAIIKEMSVVDKAQVNGKWVQDVRVKLATLWLNHAVNMQRLKKVTSKSYDYAAEEELILGAIVLFIEQCVK